MSSGENANATDQLNPIISNLLNQLGIATTRVQSTLTVSRNDYAVIDSFNMQDATTRAAEIVSSIESSSRLLKNVIQDEDIRLVRIRSQNSEIFITCGE